MSSPTKHTTTIALFGATGRMGREVAAILAAMPDVTVLGMPGKSAGACDTSKPDESRSFRVSPVTQLSSADVAIDFSLPDAVETHVTLCRDADVPYVCGVTGLTGDQHAQLKAAADVIPVLWAPNMSVGVNLCFATVRQIAARLDGYTVHIHDIHHAGKQDAPSGTALEFGRLIQEAATDYVEIEYSSQREGQHPGEHHIRFLGSEESLELRHQAGSRGEFARGAIRAAQWLPVQPPALYNMLDLLSITTSA